jgi:diguanylate cyclase (GGDEF)-like protein/PAS domain S-box-containing protein
MKRLTILRRRSIGAKLSLLVVINGSIALLLVGIFLFGYDKFEIRRAASRELSVKAGILAASSVADLIFEDERGASRTLATLYADPALLEAALYGPDNHLFAWYERSGEKSGGPAFKPRKNGIFFENDKLVVSRPVWVGSKQVGALVVKSSMKEAYSRSQRYIGIVCLVLLASLGFALLLSGRMRRTITEPITELSEVAKVVSAERSYSRRAVRRTNDEVGLLVDSFNEMLTQIEVRDEARREAEESLRESEERYALAARGANDGLWDWKLTTGKIYFSPRWNQMLGYAETEEWTGPEDWFSRIHPSDRDSVASAIAAHRAGATREFVSEYRMRAKNGAFVWMLCRGIAVRDENGTAIRMAGSQTDITEGKVADPLTGLPNRLYLLEKLDSAIESSRSANTQFAVLFIDLDRFKLVNDSLGHAIGDELLIGIAGRVRSSTRAASAGRGSRDAVVARLGGDEFAVLVHDIGDKAQSSAIAQEVLRSLSLPFQLGGRQMFATASIGITLSSSGNTPEDLLRNADTAMYHAKAKGRARFDVFDKSMREHALARLEIETNLRRAIAESELVLHYQPEISVVSQTIIGYEALVRWNHPERGRLAPGEFIPVAEESDLIIQLGSWVLNEACRQMADWHKRFVFDPPLTISVNVSPRQLRDPKFVDNVKSILSETGLDARYLKLEMTESSIMENPEVTLDTLIRLKLLNIGLEMDDFGTGYSSLSYLQRFPFDTVKIDRSFVKDVDTSSESSEIVRTILELARCLK